MDCLTGRSNSCLRKIKRLIRANELYFGHNGTTSSVSFFLHRAASILARVVGFRSGRCRDDYSRAQNDGSRCGMGR